MRRAVVILLVVLLFGSGVAAGFVAGRLQEPEPALADQWEPRLTVPVERRALRDTLSAPVSVSRPVIASVRGRGGTVTWMPQAGTTVREGDVVAEVDLRPAVALAGSRPMFRSLQWGDRGEDVQQLEDALARLGFDPGPVDGRYTASTRAAWHRLAQALGYDVDGDVRMGDVVFIEKLPADLGSTTSPGEPAEGVLAELVATEPEVTAVAPPDVASRVVAGMPAMLRGPLLEDPLACEVAEIRRTEQGTELLLDGDFTGLESVGLRVTVDLAGEHGEGLVVPVSALRSRADGSVYVHAVRPTGTAAVEVEILASTGTEALVRAGSLSEGDKVDVSS